ncbi:MAG: hypothetical protein RIS79_1041 [Verrucomicrobiota bacterium]|jgi:hypothetical protein
MTQSSLTRLLIRVQIGSLIGFILAAMGAVLVMMPYFSNGPIVKRDDAYVDKTGAARTAAEYEKYATHETSARCAGVLGVVSAGISILAGFCLRSR